MPTTLPKISIITPNLNGGLYLEQAIQSVLHQRYPKLEYIILDGGSTDNSVEIIQRHADQLAFWSSEPDGGQVAAINRGLKMATGDIVNWLNADDILLPGALHTIGRTFAGKPKTEAICGWNVAFDERGIVRHRVFPQPSRELLLSRRLLPQDAVYWRLDVTRRIGLLDDSYKVRFDMDYWCRMVRAGVIPRLVPRFLSGFRLVPGQITDTLAEKSEYELAEIVSAHKSARSPGSGMQLKLWRARRRFMQACQRLRFPWLRCRHDLFGYLRMLEGGQTVCS